MDAPYLFLPADGSDASWLTELPSEGVPGRPIGGQLRVAFLTLDKGRVACLPMVHLKTAEGAFSTSAGRPRKRAHAALNPAWPSAVLAVHRRRYVASGEIPSLGEVHTFAPDRRASGGRLVDLIGLTAVPSALVLAAKPQTDVTGAVARLTSLSMRGVTGASPKGWRPSDHSGPATEAPFWRSAAVRPIRPPVAAFVVVKQERRGEREPRAVAPCMVVAPLTLPNPPV